MPAARKVSEEQWDAIWNHYIVGLKTNSEIAREFNVSESLIRDKAKRDGWVRDLDAQVKAKAASLLAQREAAQEARDRRALLTEVERANKLPEENPNEDQIVGIVAKNQVNIVIEERKDVAVARSVVTKLYDELAAQIGEGQKLDELLAQVDELEDATYNQKTHFKKKLEHTIGFSGRVDNCLKLVTALKNMIELERKVNKINDQDSEENAEKRTKVLVSFGK